MKNKVILSSSPEQTRKIGKDISRHLKPGDVVCLKGELGSGKTTLVQGMARGLGIKENVRSSSFIIVNEYKSSKTSLYHIDLYRLNGSDIQGIGLDEYLNGKGICVIEWADRVKNKHLPCSLNIKLTWQSEKKRVVKIK
ncbi:MAG: tRNA (adenosine(37)-N6)-threonylcarbamoyltransferase complex ATPase subunit type 1 TsaE [Endomicrobiales bacterium]|nr:tRNA (adenosine(37)-N6)-threonylcarbamoyltransferase complex ATPase subunit type 1 TsaE [Endomicrobiales bacterium]